MLAQNWASVYTIPQTTDNQLAFLTASAQLEADRYAGRTRPIAYYRGFWQQPRRRQRHRCVERSDGVPRPGAAVLSQSRRHAIQSDDDHRTDGAERRLARHAASWAKSTAPRPRPTASAARCRPPPRPSCSVTTTTSSSGRASTAGSCSSRPRANSARSIPIISVRAGRRPVHRPALGRRGAGRIWAPRRSIPGSTRPTRSMSHRGLSVTAGGRFNVAQINLQDELGDDPGLNGNHHYSRFNPAFGATYKLTPNLTALRRLFGSEPRADAARARLRRSAAALPDRQRAGRRSRAQAGRLAHRRGRPARAFRSWRKGMLNWSVGAFRALNTDDIINVASPIPGHEYFQNAGNTLRQGIEAERVVQMGSLDRLCQLHLRRCHVPGRADSVVAEQSVRRRQRQYLRRSRRSPDRHSQTIASRPAPNIRSPTHGKLGADLNVDRQPIAHRRRVQPEPEGAGLLDGEPAFVLPGDQERRTVRVGEQSVQPALLRVRHVLSIPAHCRI